MLKNGTYPIVSDFLLLMYSSFQPTAFWVTAPLVALFQVTQDKAHNIAKKSLLQHMRDIETKVGKVKFTFV